MLTYSVLPLLTFYLDSIKNYYLLLKLIELKNTKYKTF
jgi:hypothetical protein